MSEQSKMQQTAINISEKANLIWNIADIIGQGLYKPHEYGKIILPMTVIKRFNDTLMPTKQAVLDVYEKVKHFEVKDGFLESASGYSFYNISPFTFNNLVDDSEHIEANFRAFLAGFSENVQDVLENFEFDKEITKLANNGMLFLIIQEFNKKSAYMGADLISSADMGYIFEELVRRFSESYNEQAGAHFTSRDIIYLMTDLLIAEEKDALIEEGVVKTVYDQTMGTSQMLGCMEERLKLLDEEAEVSLFGQELNPETYAIAKADMLIKGGKADNMRQGNTLSDDKFKNYKFDYCISNPPFGIDWKVEKKAVEAEAKLGDMGRFGVGLPKINDGQQLFDLNGLDKLKDTGRMAIIHSGTPLSSKDSGSNEIRRYIIENDWLEAIVQLSTDAFYNTEITTYIWIMSKSKPIHRQGKVQLIDASSMYEKRRKSIGKKKNDISEECRDIIVKAYGEFENKTYTLREKVCESKIFDNIDFGYNKVVVESAQLDEFGELVKKKNKLIADKAKKDTENIPLIEDIDAYFNREVLPFRENSWIDKSKTKVCYEIPFTKYFYKYVVPEKSKDIAKRISDIEGELMDSLKNLFAEAGEINE
ncbi:type I restriction-modification system subunit M [Clostridioides difficile]|nr:class I SAM-dependent DNA methyltransferase [Clostridioides difficile]MDN9160255.1 type I restriction-modification system subunit M [Clostridioides difficile]